MNRQNHGSFSVSRSKRSNRFLDDLLLNDVKLLINLTWILFLKSITRPIAARPNTLCNSESTPESFSLLPQFEIPYLHSVVFLVPYWFGQEKEITGFLTKFNDNSDLVIWLPNLEQQTGPPVQRGNHCTSSVFGLFEPKNGLELVDLDKCDSNEILIY